MKKHLFIITVLVLSVFAYGCDKGTEPAKEAEEVKIVAPKKVKPVYKESSKGLERISFTFPRGGKQLVVEEKGPSRLFKDETPAHLEMKADTFTVDGFYKEIKKHLREVKPREEWDDPKAKAGLVTITFKGKPSVDHLIFNEDGFAEGIIKKAEANAIR